MKWNRQRGRNLLLILALLYSPLMACSSAEVVHEMGWSDERRDLEHDFIHFLQYTQLPDDLLQGENLDRFQIGLGEKATGRQLLELGLTEFMEQSQGDDEAKAWAHLRQGQSFLNFACEIEALSMPEGLDAAEEERFRGHLMELIVPMIDASLQALRQAHALGQSPWYEQAAEIISETADFAENPALSCSITAPYWDPERMDF